MQAGGGDNRRGERCRCTGGRGAASAVVRCGKLVGSGKEMSMVERGVYGAKGGY